MELSTEITTNYMKDGYIINKDNDSEEIIQIPYNLENILVNESHILNILNNNNVKVDKINNIDIFRKAFTHKSYVKKNIFPEEVLIAAKKELGNPSTLLELRDDSYERLEYLGDRVLKLICSFYLFNRYPTEDEGFMTRLQTKIEDKTNLAIMSKKIGLYKYFIISQQIDHIGGRQLEKLNEDIFESFLGALFLSNGFEPCCLLIVNLLETVIDYADKLYRDNNYKDILLRYYHKEKFIHPKYFLIHQEGLSHKRNYIMGVQKGSSENLDHLELKDRCIGFGIGCSKKEGEQNAAKMALIIYGSLNKDQYTNSDLYYPNWDEINNEDNSELINNDNFELDDNHEIDENIFIKNRIYDSDSDSDSD